ncbi:DUF5995 family protein [Larkinella terrae]|uniref:DUF2236 domain-containing protein n=1 Tax=Larkinella terrae TaxID=2025311 RepID=A0A7K0EKV8_9BACT|nr:DUF5995 family protein [Larkinella terrae]MRS62439.1 DUF2236 domain-containing protein [Larkinella terrae]
MTSPSVATWTDEFLWSKRRLGDPLADETIAAILLDNQKGEIDQIFQMLVRNRTFPNPAFDVLPERLKKIVEDYFVKTRRLPDWAEPFKLAVATDVFKLYGPKILLLLLCKSLPLCYTCWRGAKVLYRTGRLRVHDGSLDSFTRRLMETAQFVVNILTLNSFEHDGLAIVSIQKVRLMHAVIRYHAQQHRWDLETYGVPINQQDLVGTLLSFGVVIIDGLKQMGIELTPEESEAYLHLWKVVGHMIGVDDDLNSENADDGRFLMNAILEQQAGKSPDGGREGAELTEACIDLMNSRLSFGPFRNLPAVFVRFFIGDNYADLLDVPKEDDPNDSAAINAIQWLDKGFRSTSDRHLLLGAVGRAFSNQMIGLVMAYYNGAKSEQFYLPSALTDTWESEKPDFRIPPAKTIEEVIFYLDKVARHFRSQNNPIGLFCAIYKLVTLRVQDGLKAGMFENPVEMEQVDVGFGNRYFEALNQYFDGKPASAPWQLSFDAARTLITTDQYIFSAANAHISYDLPIVVAEVYQGKDIQLFSNDFVKMNGLFEDMYDQMNDNVGRVFRPFGTFVKYFSDKIKAVESAVMKQGREQAWANSLALYEAKTESERQRLLTDLEAKAAKMGNLVARPPWILRLPLIYVARKEFGTTAHKVDVMLRTALLPTIS